MIQPLLPGISIRLIQLLVARHFKIPVKHMRSHSRQREFAWPRQVAMALCLEFLPNKSVPTVGYYFGGRDHTTVLHARAAVEVRASFDQQLEDDLTALRAAIETHRPEPVQLELDIAA
jgi:chromosomal replication initiator protein